MPSVNSKRLYLRGLYQGVTEKELYKFLSCYGKITEVKLLPNCAFVQFESEMVASVVLETFRNQPLLGKRIVVEYSHPLRKDMRSASNSTSNTDNYRSPSYHRHPVIVTGIPPGVCWQELKDFGRLSGAMVAFCDLDRTQRGRGFIEYFTKEDAVMAVQVLNSKHLGGRPVRVVAHEGVREHVHGRLHCVSMRRHECHKTSRNSGKRRHEEAENIAQNWPKYDPTRTPETQHHYTTHSERNAYFSSRPSDSTAYDHTIPRSDRIEPSFQRISSWASRCSHHPYQPHEFLDGFYNGYKSSRNDTYRADRRAITHHPYE